MGEFDKVHHMHVWKYQSEIPLYIQYALIKKRKNKTNCLWFFYYGEVIVWKLVLAEF
jgi:hypothetical protein